MNRQEFLREHPQFTTGTELFSDDGEDLGQIIDLEDDCVVVSKGTFFAREFTCRYDDIAEADAQHAVLGRHREDLSPWRDEQYEGWNEYDRLNTGSADLRNEELSDRNLRERDETRVHLREEELQADTTATERQARIRKVVHTEMRNLTVPVSHEELVIEREPVHGADATTRADSGAFREEEINVPLREEHVEVTKRPVVKEEVRVAKRTQTEQERVSGEVRKEELEVESDPTKGRLH